MNIVYFSHAATSTPTNSVALIGLGDIALNNGNYEMLAVIAKELKSKTKEKLIADFFDAAVLYHTDKKAAVKLLLRIKPLLENSRNFRDYHDRYITLLGMLAIYHESIGNKQEAIEYYNEILSVPKLSNFMRLNSQGMKAYCQKNYKFANSLFIKALKIKPNDKSILEYVDLCSKYQNHQK